MKKNYNDDKPRTRAGRRVRLKQNSILLLDYDIILFTSNMI